MFIVGVTGRIGSGKTTVTDFFAQQGIHVEDADVIARMLVQPNTPCLTAIVQAFGECILDQAGHLNRTTLRQMIFSSPKQRQQLEEILHPAIQETMQQQLKRHNDTPYQIAAIPLLLETQQTWMQRILVVDAHDDVIYQRLRQRSNLSKTDVDNILATQIPRSQSLAAADDIIVNNNDLKATQQAVLKLHQRYLQFSTQQPRYKIK